MYNIYTDTRRILFTMIDEKQYIYGSSITIDQIEPFASSFALTLPVVAHLREIISCQMQFVDPTANSNGCQLIN